MSGFDDLFDYLIIIIVIAQFFGSAIKRLLSKKLGGDGGVFEDDHADQAGWADDLHRSLLAAQREAAQLDEVLAGLGRQLHGPDLADLHTIVRHPTRHDLDAARREIDQFVGLLHSETEGDHALLIESGPLISRAFQVVALTRQRTALLVDMVGARQGARRAYLGDADALARALLEPFQQFTAAHGVGFPDEHPICVPAGEMGEAVVLGLFAHYPVIFVPQDFEHEIMRWASVAHELGHVLWRDVPRLADEAARVVGLTGRPARLPHLEGAEAYFDPDSVGAAWIQELFCDLVTVLLLGPAGLRSAIHVFAEPDEPRDVVWCRTHDGVTLAEHPPAELRIRASAWVLDRMGFDQEAKRLLRMWRELHGDLDMAIVPSDFGPAVSLPLETLEAPVRRMLARLLDHRWDCLAGRSLESINGLSMGPGLWGRVKSRADALLSARPFNDDPRVVIAAAVEATAQRPDQQLAIGAHVRVAIRATGEGRVEQDAYRQAPTVRAPQNVLLRDAVILADILERKPHR